MFFKLVFNLIAIVAIGICGYYTTLYTKLNEDIVELKEALQTTCGRKQQGGSDRPKQGAPRNRKQDTNDNEE